MPPRVNRNTGTGSTAPKASSARNTTRSKQVPEPEEAEDLSQFVEINCGSETYMVGGKPLTGLVRFQTHDAEGNETDDNRKANELRKSIDRWESSEAIRLKPFKKAGLPAVAAPVNATKPPPEDMDDEDEDEPGDEEEDGDEED